MLPDILKNLFWAAVTLLIAMALIYGVLALVGCPGHHFGPM